MSEPCDRAGFFHPDLDGSKYPKMMQERCPTCRHVLAVHGHDYLCDICAMMNTWPAATSKQPD